jgi:hypothetical protein
VTPPWKPGTNTENKKRLVASGKTGLPDLKKADDENKNNKLRLWPTMAGAGVDGYPFDNFSVSARSGGFFPG